MRESMWARNYREEPTIPCWANDLASHLPTNGYLSRWIAGGITQLEWPL